MSAGAVDLLAEARLYGVRLVPTPAGTIKARAPKPPPPEFLAKLKAHRAELIAALQEGTADNAEERAAIIAESGDTLREWREGVRRLCAMPCPDSVSPRRWQRLVENAGRFLDGFAMQAAALGWDTAAIFGCHPTHPDQRFDLAGLVWLVGEGEIATISDDAVAIRSATGALMTYRRRRPPSSELRVTAWELT